MHSVGPPAPFCNPSLELVHELDRPLAHYVIDVALERDRRVEGNIHRREDCQVARVVKVAAPEGRLDPADSLICQDWVSQRRVLCIITPFR